MSKIRCPFCSFNEELLPGLLAFGWRTLSPDPGGCILVYSSVCANDRAFSVSLDLAQEHSPPWPWVVPPLVWSWAEAGWFDFEYAFPIFRKLLQLKFCVNFYVLVDSTKNMALLFSPHHFSNSCWYKHTAQTTDARTVTLKCLRIGAEAALDGSGALLSNMHKPFPLRRQRHHPPLFIFPVDLVVWVFLVFLCFVFCFFLFLYNDTNMLASDESVCGEEEP